MIMTVAANLWRRRRYLALLFVLLTLALSLSLVLMFFVPNAFIDPFRGVSSITRLPRLDVTFLALVNAYCWFRLCLREKPEASGLGSPTARLVGPTRDVVRFLAYAAALLILPGVVFFGELTVYSLALEARPDFARAVFVLLPIGSGLASVLVSQFVELLILFVPVVLLAPLLARFALVLPAAAAGQALGFSAAWTRSRNAWNAGTAILTALLLAVVLSLPTNRLALLIAFELPGATGLLLFPWLLYVLQLAKAMIAAAILAEILTDRYFHIDARSGVVGAVSPAGR